MRVVRPSRTLLLLRHAKSSWDDAGLDDFDRPLSGRGRTAAARIGRLLAKEALVPDLVLCSAAARARETWARAAAELAAPPPVRHLKSLYLASPSCILGVLRRLGDELATALAVGHNPGLQHLALLLAGDDDGGAWTRLAAKFPTAALAEIALPIASWSALAPGAGRLTRLVLARELV
jgi:phosphohistidine phosphatase